MLGVLREGKLLRLDDSRVDALEKDDRLLYVRNADAS